MTEKQKAEYIRELNKEHASILKGMFKESDGKNMNQTELLYNKDKLKRISEKMGLNKKKVKPDYKKLYGMH